MLLKKVYVQNLMIEQSDLIYELVCKRNGYFYVCGATTMGNDVYKTLEKVLVDRGVGDVSTYLSSMKESGEVCTRAMVIVTLVLGEMYNFKRLTV